MLVLCGCGRAPADPPARVRASVIRATPDTIAFTTDARARPCSGTRAAVLIEGASTAGAGLLVLLRAADSLGSGTFPLTLLGDSLTVPGAHVAARYVVGDVAHGFALDSGSVQLERGESSLDARLAGRGLEGSARVELRAELVGVPWSNDTTTCRFQ